MMNLIPIVKYNQKKRGYLIPVYVVAIYLLMFIADKIFNITSGFKEPMIFFDEAALMRSRIVIEIFALVTNGLLALVIVLHFVLNRQCIHICDYGVIGIPKKPCMKRIELLYSEINNITLDGNSIVIRSGEKEYVFTSFSNPHLIVSTLVKCKNDSCAAGKL